MAEIESYHAQKVEDFASLAKEHLDGEIEFYEQVSFFLFFFEPARRSATNLFLRHTHACPVFFFLSLFLN